MTNEIQALREELAKLRERVAVLEAARGAARPVGVVDWTQPVHIGSPGFTHLKLAPMEPLAPGTIICGAGGFNG